MITQVAGEALSTMLVVPTLDRLDADALRRVVTTFRDTLVAHAATINALNVYPVPDGDTGTNMGRTLDAVVAEIDELGVDASMEALCSAISHGSLMGARGNSGVILSQILRGFAGTATSQPAIDGAVMAAALGESAIGAYSAVLRPIEGTILTVVRESAEAAADAAKLDATLVGVLDAARTAGRAALARTPELLPVLADAGVVDAGGAGLLFFFDAALHVVTGEALPEPDATAPVEVTAPAAALGAEQLGDQRYEVMYFCDLDDDKIGAFKEAWGELGDSIVVVGGDGIWNCHVHTNDIGAAIEVAIDLGGRPHKIRVTDLFEESVAVHAQREAAINARMVPAAAGLPPVTTAVVAVSSGDGLAELFGQLGVQGVVTGGQTLNPSTAELLDAVAHVNADQVVLLPNNGNIIAVAEQVDALSPKHVVVVPTRSMPAALAALVVYDPEASADENAAEMADAASAVVTGEITQAVRDTNSDAGPIVVGDWIGVVRGDGVVAVASTLAAAAEALLDRLIEPAHEILTVVTGDDVPDASVASLRAWLGEHHGSLTLELHHGGQPLYPYLFGLE
jgi:DAK2 domain fusion protein YloV